MPSKNHAQERGTHTTLIDAAAPLVSELVRKGHEVSPTKIEAVHGRSGGQSQLIIRIVEAGLILDVVGNRYVRK